MKSYIEFGLVSLVAVFAPIKALIIITGVLILVDLITGILAARKRGEPIKSAALRRTVTKCFVYQCAILTGFLVEHYMIDNILPISKIAAGIIGMVELTSILENLNTIHGSNIFKQLLEKLGSINDIKKAVEEKQEEKKDDQSSDS